MRGAVVSLQVAILMMFILAIAIALAGYLYTTLYSSLQYTYIAVTGAYVYPGQGGTWLKVCISVGGSGGLNIAEVELNGVKASGLEVRVGGRQATVVKTGEVGYVRAFFPGLQIAPSQLPTGVIYTAQGFSYPFTPMASSSEPKCPGE